MTQKLSFSKRIHRADEFERALKSKPVTNKWVALHLFKNDVGSDRLGMVVSKRIVAKAVSRNRVKRVIRELVRQSFSHNTNSLDMVIRLKRPFSTEETTDFRLALLRLLATAHVVTP